MSTIEASVDTILKNDSPPLTKEDRPTKKVKDKDDGISLGTSSVRAGFSFKDTLLSNEGKAQPMSLVETVI